MFTKRGNATKGGTEGSVEVEEPKSFSSTFSGFSRGSKMGPLNEECLLNAVPLNAVWTVYVTFHCRSEIRTFESVKRYVNKFLTSLLKNSTAI